MSMKKTVWQDIETMTDPINKQIEDMRKEVAHNMQAIADLPDTEVILESTANGLGNYFHAQWQLAEAGMSGLSDATVDLMTYGTTVTKDGKHVPLESVQLIRAENSGWQPIETAPKGIDWILLGYFPEYMDGRSQGGHPKIAFWNGETWMDCCGRKLRNKGSFSPTHWMPLPTPPEPKQ
jgi:hypothetical protein